MSAIRTTTAADLTATLDDLEKSADRLSSQALTGIPDLDPSVATVAAFLDDPAYDVFTTADLRATVRAAFDTITAARSRIDDIREDALATHRDAQATVDAYVAALHAAVTDATAAPSATPDLDRFRVAMDVHGYAFAAAERDLVAAIVAANAHATACRWPAIQCTRSRWSIERRRAIVALAAAAEAVAAFDAAERHALSFDPILDRRFDVITRNVENVTLVYRARRDIASALNDAGRATFGDTAFALLSTDGWLRGHDRAAFQAVAPEPLPVEPSPVPHIDDAADDTVTGYVPDAAEWADGAWSDGFVPAASVAAPRRARRRDVVSVSDIEAEVTS